MRIIPRSEWGARYDNGAGAAPLPASEVWLHHSVTSAADGPTIIKSIEQIGEDRFGSGISYTWLVTYDGSIYEGHSPNRLGTHTGGRNNIARAICLVGNYDNYPPSDAQMDSVAWLLRTAHANGWIQQPRLNGGHRDLKSTACPGQYAYSKIAEMNARVSQGGFLMSLTSAEQRALYNRIFGELQQRWARYDANGNIVEVSMTEQTGPEWRACSVLDTADGHYIVRKLETVDKFVRDLTSSVEASLTSFDARLQSIQDLLEGLQ